MDCVDSLQLCTDIDSLKQKLSVMNANQRDIQQIIQNKMFTAKYDSDETMHSHPTNSPKQQQGPIGEDMGTSSKDSDLGSEEDDALHESIPMLQ